jgi:hypothetical protein
LEMSDDASAALRMHGAEERVDAPGETWERIHWALQGGLRGLKGRTSLARLLRLLRVHVSLWG